jgi:hypothetical protein
MHTIAHLITVQYESLLNHGLETGASGKIREQEGLSAECQLDTIDSQY